MDQGNFASEFGQVHCFFNSGVTAAYYVYFEVFKEVSVTSSAVRNTFTGEFFFAWAADWAWGSASSDNNGFGVVVAVVAFQVFDFAFQFNVNDGIEYSVSTVSCAVNSYGK